MSGREDWRLGLSMLRDANSLARHADVADVGDGKYAGGTRQEMLD